MAVFESCRRDHFLILFEVFNEAATVKRAKNPNGKTLSGPQSVNAAIKSICDIMRRANCAGAMQYVPELT